MSPRLEAHELVRVLPGPEAPQLVRGVTLKVEAGEFVAIVGPSGCGKSSLLYLLGLLDQPTTGEVRIEGRDTTAMKDKERTRLRLERIGFVFQFHFLLPELTALENIALPMRRLGARGARSVDERVFDLLETLGLAEQAYKRPEAMSGGQRQRIAIARALANDPGLIFGDEPTGNLDSENTKVVVAEFQRLAHQEGRTIICVTHDMDVAAAADRRIRMLDGRIVEG